MDPLPYLCKSGGKSKAAEVGSPTLLREYTIKDGQVTFQYNLN